VDSNQRLTAGPFFKACKVGTTSALCTQRINLYTLFWFDMLGVSIAKIASFKRMREFTDKDLIIKALRESQEMLEVSEDNLTVRRKTEIAPSKDHFQRSIYVVSAKLHVDSMCFFISPILSEEKTPA